MLPDSSLEFGQKLVGNATKLKKFQMILFLVIFKQCVIEDDDFFFTLHTDSSVFLLYTLLENLKFCPKNQFS